MHARSIAVPTQRSCPPAAAASASKFLRGVKGGTGPRTPRSRSIWWLAFRNAFHCNRDMTIMRPPPCNCNPFDIRRQSVAIGCLGSRPSDQPHAEPTAQTTAAHYDAAVARYRRKQRCTRDLTNVCVMACGVAIAIAGLLHAALRSLATQCAPSRCPPDASAHDVATYGRGRAARATVHSRASQEKAAPRHACKPTSKFNQARHKVEARSVRTSGNKNDTIFQTRNARSAQC